MAGPSSYYRRCSLRDVAELDAPLYASTQYAGNITCYTSPRGSTSEGYLFNG
ncbi:uncharacterized protein GLRG_00448 [Colletotrichum graminicola M1.001]|uniref:Uncharacterized protein n=1 Tax=Colletotrichum graminicola (strain M1.001 / M2 / FGSC 10212) TaxID=645133 RepID=E3Q2K3_COLGM|nr:uncharacterized protein GLRG_00448 [Colletotrichum graminicola M1.001]EFQ25304.1 hypothetical protein GLRG_00448 [Colletotrichum graminicola M1.001]